MAQTSTQESSLAHSPVAPPRTMVSWLDRVALSLSRPANIKRWYGLVGAVFLSLVVLTVVILVYVMPDGSDIAGTGAFYAERNHFLRGVSAVLPLLFLAGTLWSGAFIGTLWAADPSRNRTYTWVAIFSEVLVLALFFVEAGLFAGTVLLSGTAPDSIVHALHVAVLVSAAILGPVWIPYTWAALLISRRTGLFPSWLNKVCVIVIVIDIFTITGVFTLSGPFNGENGLVGAGCGVLSPLVWVSALIAWEVVEWAQYRASKHEGATGIASLSPALAAS